jgi:hypothetical protein
VSVELNHDWTEFLSLLISKRVRFVLVGGHAVAAHGEPRLTEDLDVFVEPTLANAKRLREALTDFGFGDAVPASEDLARPGSIWMLGRKPWRIDVLTKIDGVTFAQAWRGRVKLAFERGTVSVIGRKELIANKRASARDKDLRDVAMLDALGPQGRRRRPSPKKQGRGPGAKPAHPPAHGLVRCRRKT